MIDAQFRFNQCNSSVWFCVNTMTCGGSHLGFRIGINYPNFLEDLQMIIPGQFGFNCPSGLRQEAFRNIFPIGSNDKLSPACSRHFEFHIGTKNLKFVEDYPMNIHV